MLLLQNENLKDLPNIPEGTKAVYCGYNKITHIDRLPDSLTVLDAQSNLLTGLPELPPKLEQLIVSNNPNIKHLPDLPKTLRILYCNNCGLDELPIIPWELSRIRSGGNNFDYSDDPEEIRCGQYNDAAYELKLPLLDVDEFKNTMTRENYEAVVYLDKRKQIRRFTDLAMIFPDLPPYILAEIATKESPTIPAFDVYQMGEFMAHTQKQATGRSTKGYKMTPKRIAGDVHEQTFYKK